MNKKILIIYPHFPPSNLAGVHRARLFAQHLPAYGWEPAILTVDEKYYEEKPDMRLTELLPPGLRVVKVDAWQTTKPRLIGDIGLRGFRSLKRKALDLLTNEQFDFIYIPIPSFYTALLGPVLSKRSGVPFGIDYIDPWVHTFPGSEKLFSRHWLSTRLAKFLEPRALENVSLITGVAEGYYTPVFQRNPGLEGKTIHGAMPYGGERNDHAVARRLVPFSFLFEKKADTLQFVYAGAMLPKAYGPLEAIFSNISKNIDQYQDVEFHFIGTGKSVHDPNSYSIKPLAEKYGLWESIIFEYPARLPYLDTLSHLDQADAIFVLGSTEPHYTPSKVYQGILSHKPVMAVLHSKSSAAPVVKESNAGTVLSFDGENEVVKIEHDFTDYLNQFRLFYKQFDYRHVKQDIFESYSAYAVTGKLVGLLEQAITLHKKAT